MKCYYRLTKGNDSVPSDVLLSLLLKCSNSNGRLYTKESSLNFHHLLIATLTYYAYELLRLKFIVDGGKDGK